MASSKAFEKPQSLHQSSVLNQSKVRVRESQGLPVNQKKVLLLFKLRTVEIERQKEANLTPSVCYSLALIKSMHVIKAVAPVAPPKPVIFPNNSAGAFLYFSQPHKQVPLQSKIT